MKTLRKVLILATVVIMNVTLISNTKINIYAIPSLNTDYRKIANIAVIFPNLNNSFAVLIKQGLEDIQKKNEDKVRFTFFDGKDNVAIQSEILDNLLNEDNFDLFIIQLADVKENIVEDVINKIKPKNIPVILSNIAPSVANKLSKDYSKAVFLTEDFKQPAILEGKIIVDAWNTNKNNIDKNGDNILQYIMLEGAENDETAIDRTKYSVSTINDAGIKTQLLAEQVANWDKELAKDAIESLFFKYDGKIEAIIANNDAMAIGAIEALQKYGYNNRDKSKNIAVVGIDGLPEAKELVDKGIMTGTVVHNPNDIAEIFYTVAMNLINNVNPLENTNYKYNDTGVVATMPYYEYTNKDNIS
jgi:methyl-galactoside transport system substrate-binding protein